MDQVDIEVLLAYVLKKDRSWVVAHPEVELNQAQEALFRDFVRRRASGEPAAYLLGEKEFYGRRFTVDRRVLVPRSSTEGLIDFFLEVYTTNLKHLDTGIIGVIVPFTSEWNYPSVFVDIGTGSGCIAVTLACEVPRVKVIATDVCSDALDVAKENARRHGVLNRIEFRKGSLLEPIQDLREPFFVISNPPYVPSSGVCNTLLQEPAIALYAGPRGTDVLLPLMQQAREHPYCVGIVLECREDQVEVSRVGT